MSPYEIAALLVASAALLSSLLSSYHVRKTQLLIHRESLTVTRRRSFLDIWSALQLQTIHPGNPDVSTVVKNTNALELVAACWEAEIVDLDLIRRVFLDRYIEMYEKIESVGPLQELDNKDGKALLRENPAATNLYNQLKGEKIKQGSLS